ncbi:MAG: NADH-quinone oxidoreductase subunit L [Coxiella sp. RIFCSPHIGHO2_12_FULL_44_14]|nr:MAG: NADH-quinone oxidoreductase subunit L [Coxiella sp. RIFCSPHIGHO2_12_FULL_44_14]
MLQNAIWLTVFSPLLGFLLAGLGGRRLGRRGAHWVTVGLMVVSFVSALWVFNKVVLEGMQYNGNLYTWGMSGRFHFNVGFLVDPLSAVMMLIVTFISLAVHVYSIGYMADDAGYQRFFSYMSLFTFAMLMLVSANNFVQLFFGWEGVGLVSYLLIGFWFHKESAAAGSLKAFLVNRAGDVGFILGMAAILDYVGTLDYSGVFASAPSLATQTLTIFPSVPASAVTVISLLLFLGAMGKSAQVPLHVWLPESMEGPTPISALIHAATMVTAGVFMVTRMSPLYEYSQVALSVVLVIGATGALFMGLLAFVEFDIKRIIAYSTMSQLGYMMAADGASAYSAGIFHLLTHACFKALLFLAAGSVIIALHHEQDLRRMGNLKRYLPWTYACFLVGALALSAIPPFSGFYSKEAIIEAVRHSTIPGASYAYGCLLLGAFVTGYYIFRAFFMAFHTEERLSVSLRGRVNETAWTLRGPMLVLAVPSVILGGLWISWMLYQTPGLLGSSVLVLPQDTTMTSMGSFHGSLAMALHAITTLPFWLSIAGVVSAWLVVVVLPNIPVLLQRYLPWLYRILVNQYGFDAFNWLVFVRGGRSLSDFFYHFADLKMLDHFMVDGSGRNVNRIAKWMRALQSGYLYHYVLVMIIGLAAFLIWLILV